MWRSRRSGWACWDRERLRRRLRAFLESRRLPNVVLDPVIRSSSGAALLDEAGVEVLRTKLIPLCDVMTPNVDEAAALVGAEPPRRAELRMGLPRCPDLREMAAGLHKLGAKAVVITGGHLQSANDYLSYKAASGENREEIVSGGQIESRSTHGTGCAYATALACRLALGDTLLEGVHAAKEYVRKAIVAAYPLGKGIGPVNHFG
jgi:hydroxymethylpyrimidine/phosphomethylpyrimidine kinase